MKNFFFDWDLISTQGPFYDFTANVKLLLLYFKMKVDNGERIPDQASIAEELGCNRRYITQYTRKLIESGLLRIQRFSDPYFEIPNRMGNHLKYTLTFINTSAEHISERKPADLTIKRTCKYCDKEVSDIIKHFDLEHRNMNGAVEDFRTCYKLLFRATDQKIKTASAKTRSYFHYLACLLPEHIIQGAYSQSLDGRSKKSIGNVPGYYIAILRAVAQKEGIPI